MIRLLFFIAFVHAAHASTRDSRILDQPISAAGFGPSEIRDIGEFARQVSPDRKITRLNVRDLIALPRREFSRWQVIQNEIVEKLSGVGLTLGMTSNDITLFERQPDNPLFDLVSSLESSAQGAVKRLRDASEKNFAILITLDLAKQLNRGIDGFSWVGPPDRFRLARALDRKLGTDKALELGRYINEPQLLRRLRKHGINTLVELLNFRDEDFFERRVFRNIDDVIMVDRLRRNYANILKPDSCEDLL